MKLFDKLFNWKKKEQPESTAVPEKKPAISDAVFYECLKDCKNPALLEMARNGCEFEEVWKYL